MMGDAVVRFTIREEVVKSSDGCMDKGGIGFVGRENGKWGRGLGGEDGQIRWGGFE